MLQDHYAPDPYFMSIVDKQLIKLEPELVEIDRILEDDKLYQLIRNDLSQNRPKTLITGRNSTPVEVILRMLAVKKLYSLSYEQTQRQVNDSLALRWFCRIYFNDAIDHSNLNHWALLIKPETLRAFNERVTTIASETKVTRGRKLRTDGTVVESNIHYPTDSSLLADGVRVISRTLKKAKGFLGHLAASSLRDRSRSAKKQARQLAQKASKSKGSDDFNKLYSRLLDTTKATLRQATNVLSALKEQTQSKAKGLADTLETFIPRVEQVIDQTKRRLFDNDSVPAEEKIVSIFEPHTSIIHRNKLSKPTEFGHKVWLDEVDGGITSNYRVLEGNPNDKGQFQPSLDQHLKLFGRPPWLASADRGVFSNDNETYASDAGVKRVILPKPGYKSQQRQQHEKQSWFKRGRRFHVGVEGRISVLKRKHGLGRCLDHGKDGFERWVGWSVIAGNLAVMATSLAARAN